HILGEVDRLADRVGIIHRGRLLEEFDAAALRQRQRSWLELSTRDCETAMATLTSRGFTAQSIGDAGLRLDAAEAAAHPDMVAQLLVDAGVPPTRLSVEREDLEAYFLRLTACMEGGIRE
ncbi:MAG TPA: ABC transporter ATP-binding protein, partial [Chloroflexota bacterium]|nr:ABC transporter ATP-binding protein [Chloroflexota bacterium]